MKLAQVTFEKLVDIPGQGVVSELRSERVSLRYDRETNSLLVGDEEHGVSWGNVLTWKRDRSTPRVKVICPVCQRQFNNAQALGGHMGKHGKQSADG